jgi:hypothetical protein
LPASKVSPHFVHFIRSESTRTISTGEIEYPHDGQTVFNDSKTLVKSIFLRCISRERIILQWRTQGEDQVGRSKAWFFPWNGQRHIPTATGVAVEWANKRVLVSAKHVLEDTSDEIQLVLPVERPFNRNAEIKVPSILDAEIVPRPSTPIVKSDSHDLAFFEVSKSFGQSADLAFYPLPAYARTPKHPAQCVLVGFPEDLSTPLPSKGEAIVNVAARWSETLDPSAESPFLSSRDFDPEFHFLMKFRAANKGKAAPGFSGRK